MERHELGRWGSRGNRRGRRLDLLSALQSRAGFLVFPGEGKRRGEEPVGTDTSGAGDSALETWERET